MSFPTTRLSMVRAASGLPESRSQDALAELYRLYWPPLRLKPYLTGDADDIPYREAARAMGVNEGAVKVAVHRLRQRFHEALRKEVAGTVTHPEDVGDEIRYLLTAIHGH